MGARLRGASRGTVIVFIIAVALISSAWLAYASTSPHGDDVGSSGGVTTTTVSTSCKPGNGFGDQNHCHSGPPGRAHKPAHPAKPAHAPKHH